MKKSGKLFLVFIIAISLVLLSIGSIGWAAPRFQGTVPCRTSVTGGATCGGLTTIDPGAIPAGGRSLVTELTPAQLTSKFAAPKSPDKFLSAGLTVEIFDKDGKLVSPFAKAVEVCFPKPVTATASSISVWTASPAPGSWQAVTTAAKTIGGVAYVCTSTTTPGTFAVVGH